MKCHPLASSSTIQLLVATALLVSSGLVKASHSSEFTDFDSSFGSGLFSDGTIIASSPADSGSGNFLGDLNSFSYGVLDALGPDCCDVSPYVRLSFDLFVFGDWSPIGGVSQRLRFDIGDASSGTQQTPHDIEIRNPAGDSAAGADEYFSATPDGISAVSSLAVSTSPFFFGSWYHIDVGFPYISTGSAGSGFSDFGFDVYRDGPVHSLAGFDAPIFGIDNLLVDWAGPPPAVSSIPLPPAFGFLLVGIGGLFLRFRK